MRMKIINGVRKKKNILLNQPLTFDQVKYYPKLTIVSHCFKNRTKVFSRFMILQDSNILVKLKLW